MKTPSEKQAEYDRLEELGYEPFCEDCGRNADSCICGVEDKEIYCADCGEVGVTIGHQECRFPRDHE